MTKRRQNKALKKTPWFPASVRPERVGVFQVRFKDGSGLLAWSFWDGKHFMACSMSKDWAAMQTKKSYWMGSIVAQWRGLTQPAE